MLSIKRIKQLFYVHREADLAVATALLFVAHGIVFLAADDAFLKAVMAFAATVHLVLTSCFIYGIYRFEKRYPTK